MSEQPVKTNAGSDGTEASSIDAKTQAKRKIIESVYNSFDKMLELRNRQWEFFNNRTLNEFIDDSQLRLSGFVPSREEQGKESWQANVFHPVTRNKFKAILAAVALDVPQTRVTAQNDKSQRDRNRAAIMKELVRFSYDQDNKEENVFFEGWEACEKGTVIVYDGYLKSRGKRKVVKSYDPITGDLETEDETVETDNQCINFIIPLTNLYISDWHIFDIQKQPEIVWVEYVSKDEFEAEYGKYANFDQVKDANSLTTGYEADTFFKKRWENRTKAVDEIEVVKYFNKRKDQYIIIANGVMLFNSPLLLGKKKKWYPFAKTVFEPFATDFFYGNSLPNNLMGEQDVINSLWNMALDKQYKSMTANLLVGNVNKDDFDLEDGGSGVDTRIYVSDIDQVREMPIKGIDQGDVNMITLVSRGLDMSSVDGAQSGQTGKGVTAREVVIANENAKKLKGILYMFLTSLWIQKMRLRIMSILVYYPKPKVKKILTKDGEEQNVLDEYRQFTIDGAELSDGGKGTLGIQIYPDKSKLPSQSEVDIQEEVYKKQSGEKYELIAMTSDYLDDWVYDVKVVSETVFQQDATLSQMKMVEKMQTLAAFFPQFVMMNSEKLAKDTIVAYDDDPDEYEFTPPAPPTMPGMEGGAPGIPGEMTSTATAGQANLPAL